MPRSSLKKTLNEWSNIGTYTKGTRTLSLGTAVDRVIAAPEFDRLTGRIGSVTVAPKAGASQIKIKGTYFGAPGYYYCTPGTCTVGTGVGGGQFSGYFLSADWTFVHDSGAKALERDLDYLYFGWWVRENKDGMPVAVSAFYQYVGGGVELTTQGGSLNGSATYVGPAIGQYGFSDPRNDEGHGGSFTATATLNAQFGLATLNTDTGMTGRIHDFKLQNGMTPDWEVMLNKSAWTTNPSGATAAPVGHTTNTATTVWSIGENKAAPAGSWVANLYDEEPGVVGAGGDGSNHPTTVMGKFHAEYGGTHRMVGAFGAKLQLPTTEEEE